MTHRGEETNAGSASLCPEQPQNDAALIVFTRGVAAQSVKSRMHPALSKGQRVMLHRAFLQDLATTCAQLDEHGIDIIVSSARDEAPTTLAIQNLAPDPFAKCNAHYMEQAPASFAGRMVDAFEQAFMLGYRRVVMVGSDCPELMAAQVERAFELLKSEQAVLGPATDGGFYLAGLSVPVPELFALQGYGTSHALSAVIAHAEYMGVGYATLGPLSDIDTLFDLQGLYARLAGAQNPPRSTWNMLTRLKDAGVPVAERSISVIVPVYNESAQVAEFSAQLRELEPFCELVLVDGGSTDGTRQALERDFPVLSSPKGRGTQLNRGAAASHGELLLFLHADSRLPQGALQEVRRVLASAPVGCFGIKFTSKAPAMLCCSVLSNFRAKYRHLPFGDQGFFMERSLFDEMGGFRELPLMEDYQFSLDLQKRGIRPALARKRILTSSRRYDGGLIKQLSTMVQMGSLRKMYRDGVDPAHLAELYRDVR